MVKYRPLIFLAIILAALVYSFYPTIYELSLSDQLKDKNREFILEHNYYWPDFNLYLSKILQGTQGKWLAVERYTSEPHSGSLIQVFYVWLGQLGRLLHLDPNGAYQLGRIILSPLLLIMMMILVSFYFRSFFWQAFALIVTVVSGSFPHFYTDGQGVTQVGRFMEWWSNIDAVQRLTFIPHILFGQVISFFLLYKLTTHHSPARIASQSDAGGSHTTKDIIFYILLGNLVGLVFPPSLMTLNGTLIIMLVVRKSKLILQKFLAGSPEERSDEGQDPQKNYSIYILFFIFTLPSLLYFLIITQQIPWSALVEFHRTHPMMIPFWEYILGTGPIFFLGILGAVISVFKRDNKFQPLIFWIITTFAFALLFTYVRQQSPLRFTQTGLFIPLGILGTYFFQQIWHFINTHFPLEMDDAREGSHTKMYHSMGNSSGRTHKLEISEEKRLFAIITRLVVLVFVLFYVLENLFMMTVSMRWQTDFITQRVRASIPPVPYPPQTMYPLKEWMDGVRWLRNNTKRNDVILAGQTAGNFIPAYSGNTVYFGQSNTVDYDKKQEQMEQFFKGNMSSSQSELFLKKGKIKYVFYGIQEKEMSGKEKLELFYPFLKPVFTNQTVTVYRY